MERFIEDYASLYYEFYAKIRFYGIVFNLIFMGIMFLLVEFEEEERPLWNNCNYTEVDREQYNTDVNVFVNQYLDNIRNLNMWYMQTTQIVIYQHLYCFHNYIHPKSILKYVLLH